jgi:hypothetical protein
MGRSVVFDSQGLVQGHLDFRNDRKSQLEKLGPLSVSGFRFHGSLGVSDAVVFSTAHATAERRPSVVATFVADR